MGVLTIRVIQETMQKIRKVIRELESQVKDTCIIVVLLGAGGKGVEKRRSICKRLEENGMLVLIPEDDFAPDVAPSAVEEEVLRLADVDLIFVNVESWGSTTEFGQFHDKEEIAPKLRVMVPHTYHPLYGNSVGYLTDLYLTHLAKYGHIYAYDDDEESAFPTSEGIVITLASRYRLLKALGRV